MKSSIGIAGAGLLGQLLAWQLSRAGHQVSVFELDDLRVDALLGQLVAEAPERTIAEGPGA
ncbi:NAD(P)-binding domain-containing protein [Variovorax sp. LjRoot290]|uniref:NAD(P)-binding domain-containing protein n=1 Tax=unclassified Variovorax TaxID=663243 RepID=UPI003ED1530B